METFEQTEDRVEAVIKSAENIESSIDLILKILEHQDSSICTGHLVEKMLDYFLTEEISRALNPSSNNQLFNSETAMEILDILEHQKLKTLLMIKQIRLQRKVCLILLPRNQMKW